MSVVEAYEPPAPNDWVRPWARVVLATLIGIGVAGWLWAGGSLAFKVGMCVVTLVIEVWGFNAAVQWARALGREGVGGPLAYWTLTVVACAAWTIFSIYHALAMIAGAMGAVAAPAYVAFTCLALVLPFHEWAIDRNEQAPTKAPKVVDCPLQLPRAPEAPPRRLSGRETGRTRGRGGSRANGRPALTLVSPALAMLIAQMPVQARDVEGIQRAALVAREHPELTKQEIAERAGVPRQSLGRWMSAAPDVFRAA